MLRSNARSLLVVGACALANGCADGGGGPVADLGSRPTVITTGPNGYRIQHNGRTFASFGVPRLGGVAPATVVTPRANGWMQVRMTWQPTTTTQQDDLAIQFDIGLTPDFRWIPHLAPLPTTVVAQHVFRSPAILLAEGSATLALVPDLEIVGARAANPWYVDYDAPAARAWIGMSRTTIPLDVLYQKQAGMTFAPGTVALGFYVKAYTDGSSVANPFAEVTRFLWQRFALPLEAAGEPHLVPLTNLVRQGLDWAYNRWSRVAWQQFDRAGLDMGSTRNFMLVQQSPNFPGTCPSIGFREIWNQAWFSSMRTASGLMRWSQRTGQIDYDKRARLAKSLALDAPQQNGLFPAVIHSDDPTGTGCGRQNWENAYWTNSDRHPWNFGVTRSWYHVADASWTALMMLRWNRELEATPEFVRIARNLGDRLLTLQDSRGFFPAYVDPATGNVATVLDDSPETSLSVTFLLELAATTGHAPYRTAALRALDAVINGPLPEGRWEDFETYWSNNSVGTQSNVGVRFPRNGIFKQNNLSLFWTAEALLRAYLATNTRRYLDWGKRTMDELSMWQQVWQPPYIYVPALGGFGVMNADGEWSDARQSLFAELYMDYYRATGDRAYFERGVAALKAAFTMMYSPLLPRTQAQWQLKHSFLGTEDVGFMMENYGHDGFTAPNGTGMGSFAVFDWAAGGSIEAYARILDHYGHVYVDRVRGEGFGLDSMSVSYANGRTTIVDRANQPRFIDVMYEDGSRRRVFLNGTIVL